MIKLTIKLIFQIVRLSSQNEETSNTETKKTCSDSGKRNKFYKNMKYECHILK